MRQYVVEKQSWRGRYVRLFEISPRGVATIDPLTFAQTNRWSYSDITSLKCGERHATEADCRLNGGFSIAFKKGGDMKFCCRYRSHLLAELLERLEPSCAFQKFSCTKLSPRVQIQGAARESTCELQLHAGAISQTAKHLSANEVCRYRYSNIRRISIDDGAVNDDESLEAANKAARTLALHMLNGSVKVFALERRDKIQKSIIVKLYILIHKPGVIFAFWK